MKNEAKQIHLLIAEDDADDRLMIKDAFEESCLANELHFVEDGKDLMDYLLRQGDFVDPSVSPRPGLILLDLNMPKKDGLECLRDIRSNADLKNIPVIILTTSKAEEDILKSYNLGVNSFITKPVTFDALVRILKNLGTYWFEIVRLPLKETGESC